MSGHTQNSSHAAILRIITFTRVWSHAELQPCSNLRIISGGLTPESSTPGSQRHLLRTSLVVVVVLESALCVYPQLHARAREH